LQAIDEDRGNPRTLARQSGFLFDDRCHDQRMVRRRERQPRCAPVPRLPQPFRLGAVRLAQHVKIAGAGVEHVGVRREQTLGACLARADRLQQIGFGQRRAVVLQLGVRRQRGAQVAHRPAFDQRDPLAQGLAGAQLVEQLVQRGSARHFIASGAQRLRDSRRARGDHERGLVDLDPGRTQLARDRARRRAGRDPELDALGRDRQRAFVESPGPPRGAENRGREQREQQDQVTSQWKPEADR
jgi:hypothetical protein